jgi:hypothetical protein
MAARIYKFARRRSTPDQTAKLAQAIREATPALNTIAEELRRQSTIETLNGIAARERREGPDSEV